MHDSVLLLKREFETRRLMLIILHVALPALTFTAINIFKISISFGNVGYAAATLVIVSVSGTVISTLITSIMLRCQTGIIITAFDVNHEIYEETKVALLNPIGVTTCFYFLSVSSIVYYLVASAFFSGIFEDQSTDYWILLVIVAFVFIGAYVILYFAHEKASTTAETQTGIATGSSSRLDHRTMSVEATISDMTVLIVMSVSLFSALSLIASDIVLISKQLSGTHIATSTAVSKLTLAYGICVLILSQVMFIRLRIALAEHSTELGILTGRKSYAWKATPFERSFLLYLILCTLSTIAIFVITHNLNNLLRITFCMGFAVLSQFLYFHFFRMERMNYCLRYNRKLEELL